MGYYINVPNQTKEEWLRDNGECLGITPPKSNIINDRVAVCLVDNGWMTAAGIAYSPDELAVFADPRDDRPKIWFMVHKDKLTPFLGGMKI